MEINDRRGAYRVHLTATVDICADESVLVANAVLRDISLDGVNVQTVEPLPINSICDLQMKISGPSSCLMLQVKGRIIRQDSHGTAVKFTKVDMDSYMHLKNIVLYNRTPDNA